MKILSFELTMPNVGSWNGKWTGADQKYYIIKSLSNNVMKRDHFKQVLDIGSDNWYYSFGDCWGANVKAQLVDNNEAKKRRKLSKGFAGYDWMVDSIISYGEIMNTSQRKQYLQKTTP